MEIYVRSGYGIDQTSCFRLLLPLKECYNLRAHPEIAIASFAQRTSKSV